MPTHPPLPDVPAARRHDPRAAACAGLALLGLALAAACDDAPDPVRPEAARPAASAAPAAAQVGPTAARSLLAKGFARLLATQDGPVAGSQTYNAAGGRVEAQYDAAFQNATLTLTFNTLRSVLRGDPHVQVTPVRPSPQQFGMTTCRASAAVAENGADVEVPTVCERSGSVQRMLVAAQLFDRDAPAAYATVDSTTGAATNAHQLSRSERIGEGRYRVFFKRDPLFPAGAKPIAFVTPRGRARTHLGQNAIAPCELTSVGSRAQRADEIGVEVDCFHQGAGPDRHQDAAFNVVALAQTPRTAYALVGDFQRPFAGNSHNPGGQTTVARIATGTYRVGFAGVAEEWTDDGTAMVTAHGANGGSCVLNSWSRGAGNTGVRVDVQCRSAEGDLADQRFAVLVTTRH